MAVVRARSAPPYALISFVALWVLSTVLAVLFYVQLSGTQKDLASAQRLTKDVATSNEQATFGKDLLANTSDKNLTEMGVAKNEIEAMKTIITGSATTPFADVAGTAKGALKSAKRPENEALNAAVTAVAAERDTQAKSLADLTAQLDGLNKTIADANSQTTASYAKLQKDNDDERQQLAAANDTTSKMASARDESVKSGEEKLNAAIVKAEDERRQLVLQIEQLKGEVAQAASQIAEMRVAMVNLKSGSDVSVVGRPDGQIVRVNAATDEAYINLSSADRITAGLTFSVYDSRAGVRFGTNQEAMGKGSIEVIEPGAVTSLCRITRTTAGQSIQAGDLIANPVYHHDRNRKFIFVVQGDFDLDGDGVATAGERDRLIRLIGSWGGVVADKVTSQTDYLVTGERPSAPSVIGDETPTTGSAVDERTKLQDQYDDLIVEAKRLGVPVLNANRFLSMIGYYSTTIARY